MKKMLLLTLVTVFATEVVVQAQVTMQIDSIDFSRIDEIEEVYPGEVIVWVNTDAIPRIHIEATITNNTDGKLSLYLGGHLPKTQIEFVHREQYYKKESRYVEGEWSSTLSPGESQRIVTWAAIPKASHASANLIGLSPSFWEWGQEALTDSDYVDWFKGILPTLKATVIARDHQGKDLKIISAPLDLDKVVVTSNLGHVSN